MLTTVSKETGRIEGEDVLGTPGNINEQDLGDTIVQYAPSLIFVLDSGGRIVLFNPALEQLTGYRAEEVLGENWLDCFVPEDQKPYAAELLPQMVREMRFRGERRPILTKEGERRLVEWNTNPLGFVDGEPTGVIAIGQDVSNEEAAKKDLEKVEWMLTKHFEPLIDAYEHTSDLSRFNETGLILNSVGKETLAAIVSDYLDLLGTSSAIYEIDGAYAFGIFSSGWCKTLDAASRDLCGTDDDQEALDCGCWHCHESCWMDCSRKAIDCGVPVDIECRGGIRLHAVPIVAGERIIGAINVGYGSPPRNEERLAELSDLYGLDMDVLKKQAAAYEARPDYVVQMAKGRLESSAKLIGTLVEQKQAQDRLDAANAELRAVCEVASMDSPTAAAVSGQILSAITEMSDSPFGFFGFVNDDETEMVIYNWSGDALEECQTKDKPSCFQVSEAGIWAEAIRHRQPFILNDYECEHSAKKGLPAGHVPISRLLVVPSLVNGAINSLAAVANRKRDYTMDDAAKIESFLTSVQTITSGKRAESMLRVNEQRFRDVLEKLELVAVKLDRQGNIVFCNDFLARTTGWPRDEIVGKNWFELFLPDSCKDEVLRVFEEGVRTCNIPNHFENEIVTRSGKKRIIAWNNTWRTDEDGKIVLVTSIGEDITDRERATAALEEALVASQRREAEMSALLDATQRVLKLDPFPETAQYIFDRCKRMTGATAGYVALLTETGDENEVLFLDSGGRECTVDPELPMPIRGLRSIAYQKNEAVYDNDFHNSKWMEFMPAGHARLDNVMFAPLVIEAKAVGLIGLANKEGGFDDTDKRIVAAFAELAALALHNSRMLNQLQDSEGRFRSLAQTASDAIINTDPKGHIVFWNTAAERIFGYGQDEILGRPLSEIIDTMPDPGQTSVSTFETVALRPGGKQTPIELSLSRWSSGGMLYWTAIVRDIAERKRVQYELDRHREHLEDLVRERTAALEKAKDKADAANRAKSTFLANMSHEIRTPMNAILGFTQLMLQDERIPESQTRNLKTLHNSGEHLLDLITDILEMSRIEAGRTTCNPGPVSLVALLDELRSMFRIRVTTKGLAFSVSKDIDVPEAVIADRVKLRQILVNLLGNSVKFTDAGNVALRVLQDADRLVFEVQDNGCGIGTEELENLFTPFSQAKAGAGVSGGTGLGLAISREFARLMSGDITVDSEPGRGSTFRLCIPLQIAPAREASIDSRIPIGLAPGQEGKRVLIVDDDAPSRQMVTELLTPVGFELAEALDGAQAVELAASWRPQLILMDLNMPTMSGHDAIRGIRNGVQGETIPIIVLTAQAFEEDKHAALNEGASDFLTKPFRPSELYEKIKALLGIRYLYQNQEGDSPASPDLKAGDIARISGELRREMLIAVKGANLEQFYKLIEKIEPTTAAGLKAMAQGYEYDRLIQLLEE